MISLSSIKKNWKADINAGFSLFLIAVPLSVGIAMASGAPPSAGLIAAIIGGLIGSFLGGGHVNINGPAAGLIVIVLSSVHGFGAGNDEMGFKYTLAVIIFAGVIQLIMGLAGLARYGLAFPSSVIHGMLSAIGVIILTKQIYVSIGVVPHAESVLGLIAALPSEISHANAGLALIGGLTLLTYVGFQKLQSIPRFHQLSRLPAPLVGVVIGTLSAKFMLAETHLLDSAHNFFLKVPQNLSSSFIFPDFGKMNSLDSWKMVITFALVASIESTLSAFAVDKLDPLKRHSDLNRDLWSKGICNILCGFLGGLPIIAEIVRSSANISQGAKSILSNFFHGAFILCFAAFCPQILNQIPLAALAGLLIVVGWRLGHPSQIIHAYEVGPEHVLAFLVTLVVTLASDLLIGIGAGLAIEFLSAIIMGVNPKELFKADFETERDPGSNRVTIKPLTPMVFSNSLKLRRQTLDFIESDQDIIVDLSEVEFIDHSVMDQLNTIGNIYRSQGRDFKIITSPHHKPASAHDLASRRIQLQ